MEELKSKKWRSMVLAIGAMLFEHSESAPWYVIVSVAAVAAVYLIAQGIADQGKSRVKVLVDAVSDGVLDKSVLVDETEKSL